MFLCVFFVVFSATSPFIGKEDISGSCCSGDSPYLETNQIHDSWLAGSNPSLKASHKKNRINPWNLYNRFLSFSVSLWCSFVVFFGTSQLSSAFLVFNRNSCIHHLFDEHFTGGQGKCPSPWMNPCGWHCICICPSTVGRICRWMAKWGCEIHGNFCKVCTRCWS